MDIETTKLAFQILQFVITCCVGFYVYMSNKDRVTNQRIDALEEDLDEKIEDHGERLARLERGEKSALTHEDLARIHTRVNETNTKIDELTGEFNGIKPVLRLIHEHLMNGAKR